ncbi:chemotaxis-specific protein-glutamate methyltransferase CheB [Oceanidesulfovibrio marinus]|uniref:Protein-glutamate methylesterase/protein-glutamine glutaminase n=1 Tax=Oceanidesulfovibrio marinus TaxID=370038 RepID=A0ABX6NEQ0_9BACT|nr:chemotaxis-specific protein-glutamate methyltransferase CheB [Oceanidesulfovibrio marinus]QJT09079.1 chemotaxis-specific protein-glutamate methyltransferase CheB [Oceanidesulfovibrio marinus]
MARTGKDKDSRIGVLIVDDSTVVREAMRYAVESDPELFVAGLAANGREAIEKTRSLEPDVIAMDFHMPDMNGIQATRQIMQETPTPIVIVSGLLDPKEASANFMALDAGALALLEKPRFIGAEQQQALGEIVKTLKLMSEVTVIRRRPGKEEQPKIQPGPARRDIHAGKRGPFSLVAIGASTGGPQAISRILSLLPADFSLPILIVQHIAPGFLQGLIHWLNAQTPLEVETALHGKRPLPGHVYFAPDGAHLGVGRGNVMLLSDAAPENNLRPSVSHLFRSVANVLGDKGVGVLLTGMGSDGAAELGAMHGKGALTVGQSEESCIVFGMPRAARDAGAADLMLSLDDIATMLITAHNNTKSS